MPVAVFRSSEDVAGVREGTSGKSPVEFFRCLRGNSEFLADSLHGEADGIVMIVDGSRILCLAGRSELLCGGEERFDGFVSKHNSSP